MASSRATRQRAGSSAKPLGVTTNTKTGVTTGMKIGVRAMAIYLPLLAIHAHCKLGSADASQRKSSQARSTKASKAGSPLVLVRTQGPKQVVSACCVHALRAGVRPGMHAADARAVLPPHTVFAMHDERRDERLLHTLARMCLARYSPLVGIDAGIQPAGLVLNIAGCAHLHGGEDALLLRVLRDLSQRGIDARAAIAPGYACARAIAQFGPSRATRVRDRASALEVLRGLPVAAIGTDAATLEALEEVHVRTIGQVLALPRASLAARFGGGFVRALDACLGEPWAQDDMQPMHPRARAKAERALAGPCSDISALMQLTQDALRELCASLRERGRGVRELEVCWQRSDMPPVLLMLGLSAPTSDDGHVWSLLSPRCEGLNLGHGVEHVVVLARATARVRPQQAMLAGAGMQRAQSEHALLDTLAARLGAQRVLLARVAQGHHVDDAGGAQQPASFLSVQHEPARIEPLRKAAVAAQPCVLRRPAVMLDVPAHVLALSPQGAVQQVRWMGQSVLVDRCMGPERVGGAWWNAQRHVRCDDCDYYIVRDEHARWLWLRRRLGEDGEWSVVGAW